MQAEAGPMVLIVDDQAEYLEALEHALGGEFGILTATDAFDGYALACQQQPDVILVDVMMPVVDGWTLLRKLKINPLFVDTPILIVSAVNREKVRQEADPRQVIAILQKPCEPTRVAAAIRSALAGRRARIGERALTPETP
jgi:CheY-like chemotaxis protein